MGDYTALRPTMGADGVMVYVLYPPHGGAKSAEASAKIWAVGGGNPYETEIIEGIKPHVSPDGARIAYMGQDRNLWVVNIDGTVPTQLTFEAERITERYRESLWSQEQESFDPGLFRPYSFPSWSPDGNWILMTSLEGNDPTGRPNEDIWRISARGGAPEQLTSNGSSDTNALMDPQMEYVYFLSNRGGSWAIWSLGIEDGPGASY